MICKFCNAEVEEDQRICPVCGKELIEEPTPDTEVPVQEEPVVAVADQEIDEDLPEQEEPEVVPEDEPKPKKSATPLVLSIIAAVLALASLALLLMIALGIDIKSFLPRKNDIFNKDSYTVVDDKAEKNGDTVIATIAGKELTNAQLQIYYRMQVIDFLNYYGSYLDQIGLDLEKPLSEQTCYLEDDKTWEQYLLGIAIQTWQNYQVIELMAEEENFELGEEYKQSLDAMPEDLKEQATEAGFDSVDALVQDVIGPACSEALYMDYVRLAFTCEAYYNAINEQMKPSDDEIAAYFDENADTFAESGITKEMGNIADVRHILVCPKGGTKDETTGATTYSEKEWAACLAEAEKILDEWKKGAATEESFGELAKTYTEDTGSASTGGLYEDIAPGASYVENFLNWSIDMNRQKGDTDIVKTEYGYHIMYYVEGTPYWKDVAATQMISEKMTEKTDAAEEKWPITVDYRKIAISQLDLS